MNKLILIGNGFDLAHGLPTSYKHFIDDFWVNIHLNYKTDFYKSFVYINDNYSRILNYQIQVKNFKDFEENLIKYQNEYNQEVDGYRDYELKTRDSKCKTFHFTNDFFKKINSKNSIENWVDIENEYFSELKKISKLTFGSFDEEKTKSTRKEKVVLLNKEFEQVKNLFERYLSEKVVQKFDFKTSGNSNDYRKMNDILKPIIIVKEQDINQKIEKLSKEFSFHEDQEEVKNYKKEIYSKNIFEPMIFKSYFLSFNYTPTVAHYTNLIRIKFGEDVCDSNYIHGEINSKENKINFGFGDEMDMYYKEIENIGDNEYLRNFKSFQYSNTRNYHNLLGYIDSAKYQVSILGHSCGLSDRLLLNKIFEHENCRSIKIYYYKKEDSDNYTEILQNISRHFKDKQLMRRKIVSKEFCSPLIQTVRFVAK